MTINDRFRTIRKELHLTQSDIGKSLGVSKSRISAYEKNDDIPDRSIKFLCEKYDINEEWLRTGIGPMRKELSREEEIAAYMGNLLSDDDEDKEFQKRFIKVLSTLDINDWKTIEKIVTELAKT